MLDTIDMSTFVRETIEEICAGVMDAQSTYDVVAPKIASSSLNPDHATHIEFDVAITAIKNDKAGAEQEGSLDGNFRIGVIPFLGASLKSGGTTKAGLEEQKSHEIVSRVKFSVPVYLQFDRAKAEELSNKQSQAIERHNNNSRSRRSRSWMG